MKKFAYLCCMILLSMNMMAQIDNNWIPIIDDDFHDFQGWDNTTFKEFYRYIGYRQTWQCYAKERFTGVTDGTRPHAYQTSQAYLGINNKMTLKAEHKSDTPLICGINYSVPSDKQCPQVIQNNIFYFSGMLESTFQCWFGYYEIKCKLPLHLGAKTSFWLYGEESGQYYEEIDIFENSEAFSSYVPTDRGFSCGLHYNPNSSNFQTAHTSVHRYYQFSNEIPDVTHEHTYACEWLPNRIRWFFDGEVILECNDKTEIPQHPLCLKTTHPILTSAVSNGVPVWRDADSVVISHIKYHQLVFDCDTDVAIRNVSDITGYQPGVKHSIAMGASGGLVAPVTTDIVFMASESITIDNEFTLPVGAKMTMIIQECPDTE